MTYPSELPDVSSYVDLIDRFIGRDISAPDFEKSFLQAMKSERRTLGDPVYPILQELFEDADAYVEQAELRTEPEDLDDEQLRASALRARHALSGLGYEWVNGEFYGYRELRERLRAMGYRFSTESDSEIALHLYQERGMQAATLLRGEFAMVIADERQRAMIAVRDRFGVKPLYYAVVNGDVFFASEIKALLALGVPAVWDLEGLPEVWADPTRKPNSPGSAPCRRGAMRSPATASSASIRIGIGRSPPPSRCGPTREAKPRSSTSSARRCATPCGNGWSPMSRSRRI